ncbi:tetratricopeptide repeat protein [Streptomyces sp. NRRL F-5755]|uniref:tetratricopeptide repeat protein n=1 Tax=Streptomyces sp. NRRL F-5755 TaxID=1519475 RepID=UPI001331AD81|nr:tetratricopeptide repeat protein [Streptomyces sp. NRRL F-5755]
MRIRQQAAASDNSRVYQVGNGDQRIVEGGLHFHHHHHVNTDRPTGGAAVSLEPPLRLLPRQLYGRDADLETLKDIVDSPEGTVTVLHGMGGIGKTALALSVARDTRKKRRRVLWVTASDGYSVREAMLQIAIRTGAAESRAQEAAVGNISIADLVWETLDEVLEPWLIVFDSADDPKAIEEELGTEWLRSSYAGGVLVTTRVGSPEVWSDHLRMIRLTPLDESGGRDMLVDTAGLRSVSDKDHEQAAKLANRLGGVPLALWLAGRYLALPASAIRRFEDYHAALDRDFPDVIDRAAATSEARGPEADLRRLVMQTWELSLDVLEKQGVPQARTLMRLLSCFAARPVPVILLSPEVLSRACEAYGGPWDEIRVERALNALSDLGLIDIGLERLEGTFPDDFYRWPQLPGSEHRCIIVHPLVAEVNAAQLDRSDARMAVWDAALRCLGLFRGVWPEDPRHGSFWQLLVPHVLSLADRLPEDCDDLLHTVTLLNAWFCEYLRVSGQYAVAFSVTESAYARARRLDGHAPARFLACYTFADWAWRTSRLEDAERLSREACRLAALLYEPGSFHVLVTDSLLAAVHVERGDFVTGEKLFRGIIARLDGQWPLGHPLSIQAHHHFATTLRERGFLEAAEKEARLAVSQCDQIPGFPLYTKAVVRHELGVIIWHRGRLDEALRVFDGVMRLQHKIMPPWHPSILVTRFDVASINRIRGNLFKALLEFKEISLIEIDSLGESHYATLQSRHNVAQILVQLEYLDEAELLLAGIMVAREEGGLETRHEDVLATRHELVHIASQRGQHVTALREWKKILDEERKHLGSDHPSTLRTHFNWAIGWARTGQVAIARSEMRRVLLARRRTFGDTHHETEEARKALEQLSKCHGIPWWRA